MKKTKSLLKLLSMLLMITCVSCSGYKYKDKTLQTLVFESIDYFGGYTKTYSFDFNNNIATLEEGFATSETELVWTKTFTDEKEREFNDGLYHSGLYTIKNEYIRKNISDGGGWRLNITFTDGTTKKSKGSNASPSKVFSKCAPVFYDLCEDGVVMYWIPSQN